MDALRISPLYTSLDWQGLNSSDPKDWAKAAEIVRDRLNGRFLRFASQCLKERDSGFVVLAIDCLLAETIQQFREGIADGSGRSKEMITRFLEGMQFQPNFNTEARKAFYVDIRCGLLHQAEAKRMWLIRRKQRALLQEISGGEGYIIDVEKFHAALQSSFNDYLKVITEPASSLLRSNLWKKMNHICSVRTARGALYEAEDNTASVCSEPESPEFRYKTPIDQCDVIDRKKLEQYRHKRYEWLSWYELRKGEPNTIQQQLFSMMFLDMEYRLLASARHSIDQEVTFSAQSGLLAHFLDQGYVATQVLAIRKLLDGRKDVFSLRRLLEDMSEHRNLITRENYVCHDGLPYDSEAWLSQAQGVEVQMWGDQAPGLGRFSGSRARHEMFDKLSGVLPAARQRGDLIKVEIFAKLKKALMNSTAKKIVLLSHKFFAHAATENSRGTLAFSGIKLADVDEVQRAFVQVERAITDLLLFIAIARQVVPMQPLGMFKGLEHSYASAEAIKNMDTIWDQLAEERNHWAKGIEQHIL